MAELMCPGCKSTIAPGQPYCPVCFSIPVPRPDPEDDPAAVPEGGPPPAAAPAPTGPTGATGGCADPDCGHGGRPPASGCRHCGLRAPAAGTALLFPWGPVPVPADRPLVVGRENSPLADRLGPWDNVSRAHAEVRSDGTRLTVVDLGSTNGTFVNDQRIQAGTPTPVAPGDRLRFAARLTAEVTGPAGEGSG